MIMSIILTFRFRLLPSKAQHAALVRILEGQRQLYNAALEERIECYRKTDASRSYMDQCKALTAWRRDDDEAAAAPANLQRWTLKRLDEAYGAFFRRVKAREGKAGFPRFRGKGWWRSFGFAEFSGIRLDGRRLCFAGIPGGLRVHLHRPMPAGKPLSCVFTRDAKGWAVGFQVRVPCDTPHAGERVVGIDVGLTALATLSDGTAIPNPRPAARAERELRRRQRALARCKRGSKRRHKVRGEVARLHRTIADTRNTCLHQVSAGLVRRYDLIAMEKLNVKGLAAGMLARSVHDVAWGRLRQYIAYKAERAGGAVVEVDPCRTSQICSGCGATVPKALSERIHRCSGCGLVLDRDHNAALNILHRAVVGPGAVNVTHRGERRLGNLKLEGISN